MAFSVQLPPGQRPICGQCRRDVKMTRGKWFHLDGTFRCAQGTHAAVAIYSAALAYAGGHPIWMGDGQPRWMTTGER